MVKKLVMMAFVLLAVGMAIPSTREQIVDFVGPVKYEMGKRFVPRRITTITDQLDVLLGRAEGLPVRLPGGCDEIIPRLQKIRGTISTICSPAVAITPLGPWALTAFRVRTTTSP